MKTTSHDKTTPSETPARAASPEKNLGAPAADELTLMRFEQALPFALELQTPPPALKQRILSAVRELEAQQSAATQHAPAAETQTDATLAEVQAWKHWPAAASMAALLVQRREEGQWEETGVEGVAVKKLFVDEARDYVTMLVRMQPGAAYPSHRHGGFEECYVLQGDLAMGAVTLHAGDYQRAEGGSVHVVQTTSAGCLLFIVSSRYDELMA